MHILNRTTYRTAALRTLIVAVHRYVSRPEGRLPQWPHVRFEIVYSRRRYSCTGWATYRGFNCCLRVPRAKPSSELSVWSFVWLVYHELMHLYGYKHRQFTELPVSELPTILNGLRPDRFVISGSAWWVPVRSTAKPKPKADVQVTRYRRLLERQRAWERRAKRAATALRKLKLQVRRYKRVLTAAGKLP